MTLTVTERVGGLHTVTAVRCAGRGLAAIGGGRALAAQHSEDGSLVAVTTTGAHVAGSALERFKRTVTVLAFDRDGTHVCSASDDGTDLSWSVAVDA